jgi:hypothetical protein
MAWSLLRSGSRGVAVAALLATASGMAIGTSEARAESPFEMLAGTWVGSGQIRLDNGKSEALKCRAFYTQRDAGGLGIALRCASASNKIELRASLSQNSGAVDGSWEERTFNAMGTVKGKMTPSKINLSITGGTFSGSMNVSILGERHSVSIETNGIGLKGVSINLSRG